ncbi:DUF4280 domain-containing protein [Flavobacterium tructae]|uniref:DUF4280 domain-containing protein n=1 Tax=Flavobacterium tructae TaxID=1114873 RepID=A0A1S1J9L7_9FLAO|nr:DUF4280 domain-containing protein [Flavobacterium tructae]OHT44993.1 hypothetical protein BHE19_09770 [Flavobacterium tructae]OXB16656.1 hypothetical protein B0A71_19530 [Flavobacterium tructae]
MATQYVCNGALCICDQGATGGVLDVKSQNNIFIQEKLMATDSDLTFKIPLSGICAINQKNCSPVFLTKWENPANNVFEGDKKALVKTSTLACNVGGEISITSSQQTESKIVIFDNYSAPEVIKLRQIVSASWMTGDLKNNIKNASYDEKVGLLVKTINYEAGERITIIVDEKEGKDINQGSREISLSGIVNENGFAELREIIKIESSKQNTTWI